MHRAPLALASSLILAAPALAGVTHTVYLHDFFFSTLNDPVTPGPNTLTVNAGDTVQWVWVANFHSVLQVEGPELSTPFHSALSATPGFTFEHTFTTLGNYTYICEIHGSHPMAGHPMGMWGSVTVVPAPTSAPLLAAAPCLARRARRGTPH